jgi:hypothetical protein
MQADLDFDLASLPLDVFELAGSGLEVESLTAGHGMPENGASLCRDCDSGCTCSFCTCCSGSHPTTPESVNPFDFDD